MGTTRHLARLQFEADGPAVEGEWTIPGTARDRYTEWVGLYGTGPAVVIQVIEETDGRARAQEVDGPGRGRGPDELTVRALAPGAGACPPCPTPCGPCWWPPSPPW
ncbi:hypothetical protein OG806_49555 [Streptomyces sp. NBC_00882]|uniref:hypothetical protein n=1 Tax=Streptomyces sp. NBC_00882 TaxID=2975856 RepID=UPI00387054DD|nr:hypothetical protein OG806_00395 [Streptomyces sp. NBC_00882]WSZ36864.1 hypothetical protein OG806_49555 [Streptomyces sp. NBC_00882]